MPQTDLFGNWMLGGSNRNMIGPVSTPKTRLPASFYVGVISGAGNTSAPTPTQTPTPTPTTPPVITPNSPVITTPTPTPTVPKVETPAYNPITYSADSLVMDNGKLISRKWDMDNKDVAAIVNMYNPMAWNPQANTLAIDDANVLRELQKRGITNYYKDSVVNADDLYSYTSVSPQSNLFDDGVPTYVDRTAPIWSIPDWSKLSIYKQQYGQSDGDYYGAGTMTKFTPNISKTGGVDQEAVLGWGDAPGSDATYKSFTNSLYRAAKSGDEWFNAYSPDTVTKDKSGKTVFNNTTGFFGNGVHSEFDKFYKDAAEKGAGLGADATYTDGLYGKWYGQSGVREQATNDNANIVRDLLKQIFPAAKQEELDQAALKAYKARGYKYYSEGTSPTDIVRAIAKETPAGGLPANVEKYFKETLDPQMIDRAHKIISARNAEDDDGGFFGSLLGGIPLIGKIALSFVPGMAPIMAGLNLAAGIESGNWGQIVGGGLGVYGAVTGSNPLSPVSNGAIDVAKSIGLSDPTILKAVGSAASGAVVGGGTSLLSGRNFIDGAISGAVSSGAGSLAGSAVGATGLPTQGYQGIPAAVIKDIFTQAIKRQVLGPLPSANNRTRTPGVGP